MFQSHKEPLETIWSKENNSKFAEIFGASNYCNFNYHSETLNAAEKSFFFGVTYFLENKLGHLMYMSEDFLLCRLSKGERLLSLWFCLAELYLR